MPVDNKQPLYLNSLLSPRSPFVSGKLKDFIDGKKSLAPEQLIETLKSYPEIAELYKLSAGVTENYTIEEHTLRVLEAFEKNFNTDKVNRLLEDTRLSREQFALFLALHDIGKGKAVEEVEDPSPIRKDRELQYCIEVIQKIAKEIDLGEKTLRIFKALLVDDNIGGFLKYPVATKGLALKTAEELKGVADACDLPFVPFASLKILFHKVDASSYPTLQNLFKWNEERQPIGYADHLQKKMDLLEKTLETLPEPVDGVSVLLGFQLTERRCYLTLEQFLKEDPYAFTIEDVCMLDAVRKNLKQSHSEYYRVFSNRVKWIKECKLPFRVFAVRKAAQYSLRKQESEADLIRQAQAVEDRLKVLEKLTFLHGTNSATLAMMRCSDEWALNCSGNLLEEKKAPMCGELGNGIDMYGINNHSLSVETIRNIGKAMRYAKDFTLPIEEIVRTYKHPYDALFKPDEYGLESTLEAIYTWRKKDEKDFFETFDLEKRSYLIGRFQAAKKRERQQASPNDRIIFLYVRLSWLFDPNFKLEIDFEVEPPLIWEIVRKEWCDPLGKFFSPGLLGVKGTRLLQLRQWDEDLFRQLVEPEDLRKRAQSVEEKLVLPIRLLLKAFDDELSKKEIDFLKGDKSENPPSTLKRFFPDDHRVSSMRANFGYDAVQRELQSYLGRNCFWSELITAVLRTRSEHPNWKEYRNELPRIRTLIPPQMEKVQRWYQKFYDILDLEKTPITIPKDPETRQLFTKPFPVVFASTSYRPTPSLAQIHREFNLCESVALGQGGADVIITDTEESRGKIREMLPKRLKGEMGIYLYDEIDPQGMPLIHAPHQIRV